MKDRTAAVERSTKETKIRMRLNLDGSGTAELKTGVGFFDHMLDGFARHGLFDLSVHVDGDLHVDCHHTVEDTGIVSDAQFTVPRIGDLDTEMVKEFFYAVSYSGQMNLHFKVLSGSNNHHICEAMFKAFAKALDAATAYDGRITDVLSTKGSL